MSLAPIAQNQGAELFFHAKTAVTSIEPLCRPWRTAIPTLSSQDSLAALGAGTSAGTMVLGVNLK